MKPVLLALLLLPMPNALFAQTKINKASAEQLMQMERDWSQADVKKDAAALNRILAEDWIGIDFQGTVLTKAEVLSQIDLHSDATATESTELGEMKIRIFGNTALVSGRKSRKANTKVRTAAESMSGRTCSFAARAAGRRFPRNPRSSRLRKGRSYWHGGPQQVAKGGNDRPKTLSPILRRPLVLKPHLARRLASQYVSLSEPCAGRSLALKRPRRSGYCTLVQCIGPQTASLRAMFPQRPFQVPCI